MVYEGQIREALRDIVAEAIRRQLEIGLDAGTATGGTSTTLEDTTKDWGTDQFVNAYIEITAGTGEGQVREIESNTSDTITVATAWTTAPDETSEYRIFGAPAQIRELQRIDTEASEVSDRVSGTQPRTMDNRGGGTLTLWKDYAAAAGESVSGAIENYGRMTLYTWVSGATQLTVEASPDDGSNWFEIPESPLGPYSAGEEDANIIDYTMTHLRLTTQSGVTQSQVLRGMF